MKMDRPCILQLLQNIYGPQDAPAILERLEATVMSRVANLPPAEPRQLAETDALLITYPDQIRSPGEAPLRTLAGFAAEHLAGLVNTIHILPFFPSSSDDGFSVSDYESVDPAYGDWTDIERLADRFGLVIDAVINHASVQGAWFRAFILRERGFENHFVEVHGTPDLKSAVRPRTSALLTDFVTPDGPRSIWTTFGADQADLNYRNPDVLLRVLEILLLYVARGARIIRLDAVGYIWKQAGTACIHLPEAHAIVSLIREVFQASAPHVMLLTETNVPQSDNLRYLGGISREAHLAYNFTLPPLLLHAFHTAQATALADWAVALPPLPAGTALVNILATHDGIGLNGIREFLPRSAIDELVNCVEGAGGYVSRRTNASGGSDPYELNINYMDALDAVVGSVSLTLPRFVTAHAIMLALKGIPAVYFHSLFGSRGWRAGVELTGRPRSINREKLTYSRLGTELADRRTLRSQVYAELSRLLTSRKRNPSFSPSSPQRILRAGDGLFALLRGHEDAPGQILCIHNVTSRSESFDCSLWSAAKKAGRAVDLISGRRMDVGAGVRLQLGPYESFWLRMDGGEDDAAGRPRSSAGGGAG